MIIDCNYKDKNKGFSKHENEALINLFIELHKYSNRISLYQNLKPFRLNVI